MIGVFPEPAVKLAWHSTALGVLWVNHVVFSLDLRLKKGKEDIARQSFFHVAASDSPSRNSRPVKFLSLWILLATGHRFVDFGGCRSFADTVRDPQICEDSLGFSSGGGSAGLAWNLSVARRCKSFCGVGRTSKTVLAVLCVS